MYKRWFPRVLGTHIAGCVVNAATLKSSCDEKLKVEAINVNSGIVKLHVN